MNASDPSHESVFRPVSADGASPAEETPVVGVPEDDPYLALLIRRAFSAARLFPAAERILIYLVDTSTPGWANTARARNHLHREISDALCDPDPVGAAVRKILRRGAMEASLDQAFDEDYDVFADIDPDEPHGTVSATDSRQPVDGAARL